MKRPDLEAKKLNGLKAKKLRFPNSVVNFGFNKDIQYQEGFNKALPFFSIVDTTRDINNFNFFMLYNNKSECSSFFLYSIFLNFLKKMISIKKSFFLNIFKKRLITFSGSKKKK